MSQIGKHPLARLRLIGGKEWGYMAAAVPLLVGLRLGMRVRPVAQVERFLAWTSTSPELAADIDTRLICRAVNRVSFRSQMLFGECLPRSLAAWWFLRRAGIQAEVCLGVRQSGDDMMFHAWVEIDGEIINDKAYVGELFQRLGHERMQDVVCRSS